MNSFSVMADSYRKLLEQGKISEDIANKEIRIYNFLSECTTDDFCRMFDTGAFNDILKAYVRASCKEAELDDEQINAVGDALYYLLDTRTAEEICGG